MAIEIREYNYTTIILHKILHLIPMFIVTPSIGFVMGNNLFLYYFIVFGLFKILHSFQLELNSKPQNEFLNN